jgi:hypothetical protein
MSADIGAVGGMGFMGGMAGLGAGMSGPVSVGGIVNMSGVKMAGDTTAVGFTPNIAEPSCDVNISSTAHQALDADPVNPGMQNTIVANNADSQASANALQAASMQSQTQRTNATSTLDPAINTPGKEIEDMSQMDKILMALLLAMLMQQENKSNHTTVTFSPS